MLVLGSVDFSLVSHVPGVDFQGIPYTLHFETHLGVGSPSIPMISKGFGWDPVLQKRMIPLVTAVIGGESQYIHLESLEVQQFLICWLMKHHYLYGFIII